MNKALSFNAPILFNNLLHTQVPRKIPVIKLTTYSAVFDTFGHHLSGRQINPSNYSSASEVVQCKHTYIHQFLRPLQRIIHIDQSNVAEHKSRTTSSSTVTDTSLSEDTTGQNTDMSSYTVGHDTDKKYFYITLQEGSTDQQQVLAKLEYDWVRPGLVDLYHTQVPMEFQGKGIAKVLAKAAFETFCEMDVLIRPTCSYLHKYLRENQLPSYMDHLEKDFVL